MFVRSFMSDDSFTLNQENVKSNVIWDAENRDTLRIVRNSPLSLYCLKKCETDEQKLLTKIQAAQKRAGVIPLKNLSKLKVALRGGNDIDGETFSILLAAFEIEVDDHVKETYNPEANRFQKNVFGGKDYYTLPKKLCETIRGAIDNNYGTLASFAKSVDMTPNDLSNSLRRTKRISVERLIKICRTLGLLKADQPLSSITKEETVGITLHNLIPGLVAIQSNFGRRYQLFPCDLEIIGQAVKKSNINREQLAIQLNIALPTLRTYLEGHANFPAEVFDRIILPSPTFPPYEGMEAEDQNLDPVVPLPQQEETTTYQEATNITGAVVQPPGGGDQSVAPLIAQWENS
jgi:hypothetical protein